MSDRVDWPGLPTPGTFVTVPLPLPPMLLEAVGYDGAARYVALRWAGGCGGDVMWTDGTTTTTAWWPPWRLLVREHTLGHVMFDPYDFGDLDDFGDTAVHWLLADRWEHTLHIGLAVDVQQFLRTQPSELGAVVAEVGPERARDMIVEAMTAAASQPPDDYTQVAAARAEKQRELQSWLDDLLGQIDA